MRVAIIDLGTNTFHLMIAEKAGGTYSIIYRERLAVKLGLAGINQGLITPEALQRALVCMADFRDTIQTYQVTTTLAFGTSALRNAKNADDVIAQIKQHTGIVPRIISGDQEAEYIYRGVQLALNLGDVNSLIIDIGGGSVEFIIGNRHTLLWKRSLEIGAQRLLETYHKNDPIRPDEIKELDAFFATALLPLFEALHQFRPVVLVGSSGTFDTLSDIYRVKHDFYKLPDDPEIPLTFGGFYEIYEELLQKNRTERLQIPGMIEMRVDMIVVASCLIRYIIERYSFQSVRVSTYALKEGVMASL
jgi:exopolyphosphatase/guanosine-5'-triphosphate,3'-diphosphate pyrophosphatase